MVDPRVVNEWLDKANEDFDFADANLREESTFYAQICFHFHQAAEKYLKTFIIANDLEFEKIHNLITLLKSSSKIESSLSSLLEACEFLNTSYIDTRYPVYWPTNYTKEKALKAKESAKKIGETIKELLKKAGYV